MANKNKYTNSKILHDLKLGDPVIGEGPKKSIFGSDKNVDKKLPILEKANHSWDLYKKYNEDIFSHPNYVNNFIPRDTHVLIKCFKFESDNTTESGLILQNDVEWYETPGGQKKMRTSTNPFQKRAIVVKKGYLNKDNEFYNNLSEGTIITLSTNKLDNAKFDLEPEKKGNNNTGYFLIHVGLITGIETNK